MWGHLHGCEEGKGDRLYSCEEVILLCGCFKVTHISIYNPPALLCKSNINDLIGSLGGTLVDLDFALSLGPYLGGSR